MEFRIVPEEAREDYIEVETLRRGAIVVIKEPDGASKTYLKKNELLTLAAALEQAAQGLEDD